MADSPDYPKLGKLRLIDVAPPMVMGERPLDSWFVTVHEITPSYVAWSVEPGRHAMVRPDDVAAIVYTPWHRIDYLRVDPDGR